MKKVQRLIGWLLMVVVAGMFAACDENWNLGSSPDASTPTTTCCPTGQQYYVCSAQVQVSTVQLMGMGDGPGVETRCFTNTDCESTQDEAQKSVLAAAQLNYSEAMTKIVTVQTVECKPSGNCATTQPQDYFQPLDFPGACNEVGVVDAGAPAPDAGSSCTANADACNADTDCCSGLCSEQNACEACRAMLEGCTTDAECCSGLCSLNACGGSGLPLHDGGLGFGGGSP